MIPILFIWNFNCKLPSFLIAYKTDGIYGIAEPEQSISIISNLSISVLA
jgi:hypothetical protein